MEKIVINGGKPLMGAVEISGMKNAAEIEKMCREFERSTTI